MSPKTMRALGATLLQISDTHPFVSSDVLSIKLFIRGFRTFLLSAADKEERLGKELDITDVIVANVRIYLLNKFQIDILDYPGTVLVAGQKSAPKSLP